MQNPSIAWILWAILAILVVADRRRMAPTRARARAWVVLLVVFALLGSFVLLTSRPTLLTMIIVGTANVVCLIAASILLSWKRKELKNEEPV